MDELEKEKNKIKSEANKIKKAQNDNIRKEIKENYKIGVEYYKEIEEQEK